MTVGQWVLVVSVVLAGAFGSYRAFTDGRFAGTHRVRGGATGPSAADIDQATTEAPIGPLAGHALSASLGQRATLVQFSSAFCAPCRATRRILTDIAETVPGVSHLEIDAEQQLDLVRRLGILRTPTTLVLDAAGREVSRATGAPRKEQVLAALAEAV
ncbi:MAG: thioredoxin family protein [Nocardioides sp.]|uniref:TlpA family protein disulfide reductase n=1 Tax=Nocardioides sp. TaxID=35761 RepID=UPI0039E41BCA